MDARRGKRPEDRHRKVRPDFVVGTPVYHGHPLGHDFGTQSVQPAAPSSVKCAAAAELRPWLPPLPVTSCCTSHRTLLCRRTRPSSAPLQSGKGFNQLCRHGFGKWQAIISDPDPNVGPMLAARTNVDLKARLQHPLAFKHRSLSSFWCTSAFAAVDELWRQHLGQNAE